MAEIFLKALQLDIIVLGFTWISISYMENVTLEKWWFSTLFTGLSLVFILLLLWASRFIRSAILFYVLHYISLTLPVIVCVHATFAITLDILGMAGWIWVITGAFLLVFFLILRVRNTSEGLQKLHRINAKKGALNLQKGEWDLIAKIYYEDPEIEQTQQRKYRLLEYLSHLAPALGMTLGGMITGRDETIVVSGLNLLLASTVLIGFSQEIALIIYLRRLETELHKKITLKISS